MSTAPQIAKPFAADFDESGSSLRLALTNTTAQRLKQVEVLTIFLRDEDTPGGGPSRAHLKFETISQIQPNERVFLTHRTWVDGRPANPTFDSLDRLLLADPAGKRYVLDISWEDPFGKSQFQRIPVGQ